MAGLIIEVVDRSRGVSRIERFAAFPVRVGRGYENDLIVPDPLVSPEHLFITEGPSGFVVEDLDTENGVYVRGRRVKERCVPLASGAELVIGATSLRLCAPSHPVPPAQKAGYWSTPGRRAVLRLLAWASLLPTAGVLLLDQYLRTFAKVRLLGLIDEIVPIMIGAFAWAAFWALIGYSVRRRTRFHAHLLLANAVVACVTLVDNLVEQVAYAANSTWVQALGKYLFMGPLLFVLLFLNLAFATGMTRKRRLVAACCMSAAALLVLAVAEFADEPDFKPKPAFSGLLKPPGPRLARTRSIEAFVQECGEVFDDCRAEE
ncbi:MAG: FHA domain-containing protein [Kiritimatiellae bacterium]|nr:FHA domain-containing protein [Kiritimatiellia bacterium]